jgi:hypothetical protein
MRHIFILSLASLIFLCGCASNFYIPSNRFLIPESSGELLSGEFRAGAIGVAEVQVADDMTLANPNTTPQLTKNTTLGFGLDLGFTERFGIYIDGATNAPSVIGVKYQFMGDPLAVSEKGNKSLALAVGVMNGSQSEATSVNSVNGNTKFDFSGWESVLLVGYRPYDELLLYGGPFISTINAQVVVSGGPTGGVTAEPDGSGGSRGCSFGVRYGELGFIDLEFAYLETNLQRTSPTALAANQLNDFAIGLATGGSW